MSVLEDVCACVYVCVRSRGCVLMYSIDERLLLYVPSTAVRLLQGGTFSAIQYNTTLLHKDIFVVSSEVITY